LTAVEARDDVDLSVRFMRAGSPSGRAVESRFPFVVMRGLAPRTWRDEFRVHPRAIWEVLTGRFDCYVLSGLYTSITFLLCLAIARLLGRYSVVWLERPHPEHFAAAPWSPRVLMSRPARAIRRWVQRIVVRWPQRVIAIGTSARQAYLERGAEAGRVDVVPYCMRLDRFDQVSPADVQHLREVHSLSGRTVFLFSGQMIPRKGVDTLLAAFQKLADESPEVALLVLGDGLHRSEYEALVRAEHRSRVHFLGHVDQGALPTCFAAADVFVFPSRHDGWGVVINEACAARLPVIASRQTGAAADLVEPGHSGFVLDQDDVDGFAAAMGHFVSCPDDLTRFGARSRALVEQFSPEAGAAAFTQAVFHACQS
jgi:glycosyltransferase involved in cell wall biosynthesis